MKQLQKGFTLIELMIVVAIIGILAAIAVPAYQDYTIRSRVSEAASLASAVRTAIDVSFSEGIQLGSIPTTPATLGVASAASYAGKYVSSVAYNANGQITIQLRDIADLGLARNRTITYSPRNMGANLQWVISNVGTYVPEKYRPKT
jgi:type IV pilus assembly protein PilA